MAVLRRLVAPMTIDDGLVLLSVRAPLPSICSIGPSLLG